MTKSAIRGGVMAAMLLGLSVAGLSAPESASPLIGCWRCDMEGETSLMEFREDMTAIIDGEESQYELKEGAIRMSSALGPIDYPYVIAGNTLTLSFMGVIEIPCARVKCGTSERPAPEEPRETGERSDQPAAREQPAGGKEYLLRGMFCHWSGSSSSYSGSGYSHSLRVSFDGQGHFATGSESSFGSSAGIAYGTGDGSGGTYRVAGNEVRLQFNDGSTGVATVELRDAEGTITALKYNGDLYAPQLCE